MASFNQSCPHCQSELTMDSDWIGMEAACPVCKHNFKVEKAASKVKMAPPRRNKTSPIQVLDIVLGTCDMANNDEILPLEDMNAGELKNCGLAAEVTIANRSNEVIKYIDLDLQAVNRGDDLISEVTTFTLTGPLSPGETMIFRIDPLDFEVDYDNGDDDVDCSNIADVDFCGAGVEFMSGKTVEVDWQDMLTEMSESAEAPAGMQTCDRQNLQQSSANSSPRQNSSASASAKANSAKANNGGCAKMFFVTGAIITLKGIFFAAKSGDMLILIAGAILLAFGIICKAMKGGDIAHAFRLISMLLIAAGGVIAIVGVFKVPEYGLSIMITGSVVCLIGAAIYHSLKPPCPHCHRDNALIPIKSVETGHTPSYWRKDHNDKWGQAYKVSKDVTYQCRFCGHCTLYEETEEKSLD